MSDQRLTSSEGAGTVAPSRAWIGLGANLGDPRAAFGIACRLLEARGLKITARSRLYRTRPWGVTDQPEFLNAAIEIQTKLPARKVLEYCQAIESVMGRKQRERWREREIDLDLLMMEGGPVNLPNLTLPHPQIAKRDFVMAPLANLDAPVPDNIKPGNWGDAIAALPEDQRSIIASEEWTNHNGRTQ